MTTRPGSDRIGQPRKQGFTLVGLLVVITIIAILIALLLPAVQMAREAARRGQCSNNLKQLSLACTQHENVHGFFPTGGWGWYWVGDPNRDFDRSQPGGWCYNILPYIEQQHLHDLGLGAAPGSAELTAANLRRLATPLTVFTCPTRRAPTVLPVGCVPYYCGGMTGHVSTCYAGNAGETSVYLVTPTGYGLPTSYGQGDSFDWRGFAGCTGIFYIASMVKVADITDGATNTFLLGEKEVNPDHYLTGQDGGDDWAMYSGCQDDICRGSGIPSDVPYYPLLPSQDRPGNGAACLYFGSPHSDSLNMSMCDASVRPISYSIELETYRRLCNRKDGLPIDASKY